MSANTSTDAIVIGAGEVCLAVANATRQRLLTQIFGALTETDRATLIRLLGSLDEAAQRVIDPPAAAPAPAPSTAPAAPVPA